MQFYRCSDLKKAKPIQNCREPIESYLQKAKPIQNCREPIESYLKKAKPIQNCREPIKPIESESQLWESIGLIGSFEFWIGFALVGEDSIGSLQYYKSFDFKKAKPIQNCREPIESYLKKTKPIQN